MVGANTQVYSFNRDTNVLVLRRTALHGDTVEGVSWSPDGGLIATGGQTAGNITHRVYTGFTFPCRNIIKDNVVYCTEGNECPAGVGISGSSIANCIVGNRAYGNIKNYEFVTNVFDPRFGHLPSDLQNLCVSGLHCKKDDIIGCIKNLENLIDAAIAALP